MFPTAWTCHDTVEDPGVAELDQIYATKFGTEVKAVAEMVSRLAQGVDQGSYDYFRDNVITNWMKSEINDYENGLA